MKGTFAKAAAITAIAVMVSMGSVTSSQAGLGEGSYSVRHQAQLTGLGEGSLREYFTLLRFLKAFLGIK